MPTCSPDVLNKPGYLPEESAYTAIGLEKARPRRRVPPVLRMTPFRARSVANMPLIVPLAVLLFCGLHPLEKRVTTQPMGTRLGQGPAGVRQGNDSRLDY